MFIRDNKRFNIYASSTIEGVTYPNFLSPELRDALGITEIVEPEPPVDYTPETYFRTEQDTAPYVVYEKKSQEQLDALAAQKEAQRISSLWQAAHDKEFQAISGSAIGLLALGAGQGKLKCLAVQGWIKSIWDEYYTRKASGSTDTDFTALGDMPYSVPELVAEVMGA